MTNPEDLEQPVHAAPLYKRVLQGAGLALILVVIFLLLGKNPNPEAGPKWMIMPLIMVPVSGGIGGLFYYMMDHLRYQGGWKKILANVSSVLVYLFLLLIGLIAGLSGAN